MKRGTLQTSRMLRVIRYASAVDILLIDNGVRHRSDIVLQVLRGAYSIPPRYAHVSIQTKHKEMQEIGQRGCS